MPSRLMLCLSLLLACAGLCPPAALAAEVTGLNEAEVPVESQAASERDAAILAGFRQVLVKTGGQRSLLGLPGIERELSGAAGLLAAWRYEVVSRPGSRTPLLLRMTFDGRGIRAALNRLGAPVWSSNRPLVYLRVGSGAGGVLRQAWGPASRQGAALIEAAGERGLPVLMDAAQDAAGTAPALLPPAVEEAARRQGARVVLAATVAGSGARWTASGLLAVDGQREGVEASGTSELEVLRELLFAAADRLGARYAVVATPDALSAVRLRIAGESSLSVHAQTLRWLRSLPLVRDVQVESLAAGATGYRLLIAGESQALQGLLEADGRLVDVRPDPLGEGGLEARLAGVPAP